MPKSFWQQLIHLSFLPPKCCATHVLKDVSSEPCIMVVSMEFAVFMIPP